MLVVTWMLKSLMFLFSWNCSPDTVVRPMKSNYKLGEGRFVFCHVLPLLVSWPARSMAAFITTDMRQTCGRECIPNRISVNSKLDVSLLIL